MTRRSPVVHFIVLLCVVGVAWAARLEQLGITRDPTKTDSFFHWEGAMRFTEKPEVIVDKLPALAKMAYDEMVTTFKPGNPGNKRRPATMAALAIGSDVYFSSSLKGKTNFILDTGARKDGTSPVNPPVVEELRLAVLRCQLKYTTDHRYDAKCAETLAIQAYINSNADASTKTQGRITTYSDVEGPKIVAPCEADEDPTIGQWGCRLLLEDLEITAVGENGKDPGGIPELEQGTPLKSCIWPAA